MGPEVNAAVGVAADFAVDRLKHSNMRAADAAEGFAVFRGWQKVSVQPVVEGGRRGIVQGPSFSPPALGRQKMLV